MKLLRVLTYQLAIIAALIATSYGLTATTDAIQQGQLLTRPTGTAQAEKLRSAVTASDTTTQLSRLKHRWNFASLDCAAVVHRTNPSAKFASSILSEKKDRYMLSPCPTKGGKTLESSQFVIVELCEEIKIDTIVLANYEFFSSMFKSFKVTAARQLTGREDDWVELGTFRARNVRGIQVFRIPSASTSEGFFRYVRIDFLEHFGSEYYCPVSLLRVYGLTQMEEFSQELGELDTEPVSDVELVQQPAVPYIDAPLEETASTPISKPQSSPNAVPTTVLAPKMMASDEDVWSRHEQLFQQRIHNETVAARLTEAVPLDTEEHNASNRQAPLNTSANVSHSADLRNVTMESDRELLNGTCPANFSLPQRNTTTCPAQANDLRSLFAPDAVKRRAQQAALPAARSSEAQAVRITEMNSRRNGQPKGNGHQATGGTESVYRAIHRRLSSLEANASLSLSYIEHSGLMLREVFARMEQRQEGKMSMMLEALNSTNWKQIDALKRGQHVDLQRAIFEFDVHRQQAETERLALLREVHLLASEVLLEKRLSIAQLILLFAVFVFVGMTRGSRTAPLIHSGFAKISASTRRKKEGAPLDDLLARLEPQSAAARSARAAQPQVKSPSITATGKVAATPRSGAVGGYRQPLAPINLNTPTRVRHAPIDGRSAASARRANLTTSSPAPATPAAAKTTSKSGKSRSRGDPLLSLLMDKGLKGRLVALLNTLELLEDDIPAVRRSKSNATARNRSAATASNVDSNVLAPSPMTEAQTGYGTDLSKTPAQIGQKMHYGDDQHFSHGPYHGQANLDGDAVEDKGMSSDWTEKSETEEASEGGAVFSEGDDEEPVGAFSPIQHDDKLRHGDIGVELLSPPTLPPQHQPRSMPTQSEAQVKQSELLPAMTSDLPTSYTSDSESDGGAWQRVLPRRLMNGSFTRRPRTGSMEGARPHKSSFDAERASAPPEHGSRNHRRSSLQGGGRVLKPSTPDSLKRFWGKAPSSPTPEQNRCRSETPDTIRGDHN